MKRSDLRTLSQRKTYDLLYNPSQRRKKFFDFPSEEDEIPSNESPPQGGHSKDEGLREMMPTGLEVFGEQFGERHSLFDQPGQQAGPSPPVFEMGQQEAEPLYVPSLEALPTKKQETIIHKPSKPTPETAVERATKHDAYCYFKDPMPKPNGHGFMRIIGEDHLGVLLTLLIANNQCFGIEGREGSSKTLHMIKVLNLLDPAKTYITSQCTESALFEDCYKINQMNYLILTELQKVGLNQKRAKGGRIIEALKDLAEGRPAKLAKVAGNGIEERVINPIPFCYTRATTNPWDSDREFKRRMPILYTNNDPEMINERNRSMFEDMHKIWANLEQSYDLENKLKHHINRISKLKDIILFDPYSDLLSEIIPSSAGSTCRIPHYENLLTASVLFDIDDRMKFSVGKYTYAITDLEDHYQIHTAYHPLFISVLRDLAPDTEKELFDTIAAPDWSRWFAHGAYFMQQHPSAEPIRKKLPGFIEKHAQRQLEGSHILAHNYTTGEKEAIGSYGGLDAQRI